MEMSNQPMLWCVEVKKTIITHAIIELERVATVSTSFRLQQLMTLHFVVSDHELFGSRVSYSFGILAYILLFRRNQFSIKVSK